MTTTDRAGYIAGLRQLADILEQNPALSLPYGCGTGDDPSQRVTFYYLSDEDPKGALAEFARIMPGPLQKQEQTDCFALVGKLGALHFDGVVYRGAVCERIVTGTETVTRTVPDPDALAAVPTVEVTETVEHVEWRCLPILAGERQAVPA
jgi:hypothetical protein